MIYTELTKKAMKFAYDAHHGQYDKAGVPYIFHPMHLAEQMEDEVSACAALLHDVIEDTEITLEELEKEFPKEVTEVVSLLTHEEEVSYMDYLKRLKPNPIAYKIKMADLNHNSDETRLTGFFFPEEKKERLRQKYQSAKEFMNE